MREARIEERRLSRTMATRYSAGVLTYKEVRSWLNTYLPDGIRAGRIVAELIVTREAFDNIPGDTVKRFGNRAGDDVYRKTLLVKGSPMIELNLVLLEPNHDAAEGVTT